MTGGKLSMEQACLDQADLPLFVSVDSILCALHRSYDQDSAMIELDRDGCTDRGTSPRTPSLTVGQPARCDSNRRGKGPARATKYMLVA